MVFPQGMKWNDRIYFVRAMKRQTQAEASEEVGTTRKQFYNWEGGKRKPMPYYQTKLSQWAGVPEDQLFRGLRRKKK